MQELLIAKPIGSNGFRVCKMNVKNFIDILP
jgi:hypothetical protein